MSRFEKSGNSEMNSSKMDSEEILSLLSCSICTELLKKTILCKNGHTICRKCSQRVDSCPLCRGKFTKANNLAIENIVSCIGNASPTPPKKKVKKEKCVNIEISQVIARQELQLHFSSNSFAYLSTYDMYFDQ